MTEKYKEVLDADGKVFISNLGNLKKQAIPSLKDKSKVSLNARGYHTTQIKINGIFTSVLVHRLVAEAFIPNPEDKPQVNHKNGIKSDNRVDNLEWCTCAENIEHAVKNGYFIQGEDHWKSKVTSKVVDAIRSRYKKNTYGLTSFLARKYGISTSNILSIVEHKTWKR